MPRWQFWALITAVVSASVSALKFPLHELFVAIALLLMLLVGYVRVRASLVRKNKAPSGYDAAAQARAIRENRNDRFKRY